MKHIIKGFTAVIMAYAAVSCNLYKEYSRPGDVIDDNLFGDDVAVADTATFASLRWREFFTDPHLQALIDSGLVNNSDLRIASLRVARAEASLSAAKLAYLPSVSFDAQGNISSFAGEKASDTYSLGLSADWELDIVGRVTNEKRAAFATLQQERSYRQAVSSQLIATIANTYYNILALDEQLDISSQSLDAWSEIIRTLEARKRVGESNEAAVAQAKGSKYEVENSILSLMQQRKEMENSLCTLLGWSPRTIMRGNLKSQTFPDTLSVGVPLRLLDNRPDIRQAEYALRTAFYSTNVARAAFYPSLTLRGTVGWTNNSGAAIVNPGNWLLNALGSLTQPLFSKGRNRANLKIAEATQQEALINFRQKLLDAGAEVNNALSQWQTARQRLDISRKQIDALEDAVAGTRLLMMHSDNGSYLEVLTAQQTLLSARLTMTTQTFDKIQGIIKLYHALGGD